MHAASQGTIILKGGVLKIITKSVVSADIHQAAHSLQPLAVVVPPLGMPAPMMSVR
jgi:hypothetical protein